MASFNKNKEYYHNILIQKMLFAQVKSCSLSKVCNDDNLRQWFQLEIQLSILLLINQAEVQFITINIISPLIYFWKEVKFQIWPFLACFDFCFFLLYFSEITLKLKQTADVVVLWTVYFTKTWNFHKKKQQTNKQTEV